MLKDWLFDLRETEIVHHLLYATKENFTGKQLYFFTSCLLHRDMKEPLLEANAMLKEKGLQLKVVDGYRPMAVQQLLWDLVQDDRYVAPPEMGGRHCRGTAVDLFLIDLKGKALPMPTAFDTFSERAHRDYESACKEENENRDLLENVMHQAGFIGLPTEWWHFDLRGWEDYPVIDFDVMEYEKNLEGELA